MTDFVTTYNNARLHSALGYITPADKLAGRDRAIFETRDRKLEAARQVRAQPRATGRQDTGPIVPTTHQRPGNSPIAVAPMGLQ